MDLTLSASSDIVRLRSFGVTSIQPCTRTGFAITTMLTCTVLMSAVVCFASILRMIMLAEAWSGEMWVVVVSGSITALATSFIAVLNAMANNKIKVAQKLHELQRLQDSKERKEVAAGVANKVEQVAKDLKKDIADNTKINVAAIEVANGHNQKIAALTEAVASVPAIAATVAASVVSQGQQSAPTVNLTDSNT